MSGAGLFNGLSILAYIGMFACVYWTYKFDKWRNRE